MKSWNPVFVFFFCVNTDSYGELYANIASCSTVICGFTNIQKKVFRNDFRPILLTTEDGTWIYA